MKLCRRFFTPSVLSECIDNKPVKDNCQYCTALTISFNALFFFKIYLCRCVFVEGSIFKNLVAYMRVNERNKHQKTNRWNVVEGRTQKITSANKLYNITRTKYTNSQIHQQHIDQFYYIMSIIHSAFILNDYNFNTTNTFILHK